MNLKEKCCGECVPFACVVNNKEYKIGEKWQSEDNCVNYVCLNKNGNVSFGKYAFTKMKKYTYFHSHN